VTKEARSANIKGVKLTDEERQVLRRLGKRSRAETEKRLGKQKLIEVARAQANRGIEGGRPHVYPICTLFKQPNGKARHRFFKGVCRCGVKQDLKASKNQ
jgi:hypothetical protein